MLNIRDLEGCCEEACGDFWSHAWLANENLYVLVLT